MHLEAAISKPDGWKNISLSQPLNTLLLFSHFATHPIHARMPLCQTAIARHGGFRGTQSGIQKMGCTRFLWHELPPDFSHSISRYLSSYPSCLSCPALPFLETSLVTISVKLAQTESKWWRWAAIQQNATYLPPQGSVGVWAYVTGSLETFHPRCTHFLSAWGKLTVIFTYLLKATMGKSTGIILS